jgi:hypothetical protein
MICTACGKPIENMSLKVVGSMIVGTAGFVAMPLTLIFLALVTTVGMSLCTITRDYCECHV